jgi:hypothetical protein
MSLSSGAAAVLPAFTASEAQLAKAEPVIVVQPKDVRSESYEPLTDPKNVERFLKDYFADMPIMARIAKCESRNRHFDSNGQVLKGEKTPLDRGVMQINLYYHEATAEKMGLDVHNIDDNVAFARYLYEKYGAKPWMSSSACWSKPSSDLAQK